MLLRAKLIDKCLHYIEKGSDAAVCPGDHQGVVSVLPELGDGDPSVGDLVGRVEQLEVEEDEK